MDVIEAIAHRQSVRAFLDKPVSNEMLLNILETAKWAPSGVNTQPWHVAIVGEKTRHKIGDAFVSALEGNLPQNPDYQYYPSEWTEPYQSRRKACGLALYGALDIQKTDIEKRKAQWYRNYYFFHAPAGLLFFIDKHLEKGSWMDMGMFIQNVMIAARGYGLETCPQAALAEYPDIIRQFVQPPADQSVVCGMALGYADWEHPVNQYRTSRVPAEAFTQIVE